MEAEDSFHAYVSGRLAVLSRTRCSVSAVKRQTRDTLAALGVRAPDLADLARPAEVPA